MIDRKLAAALLIAAGLGLSVPVPATAADLSSETLLAAHRLALPYKPARPAPPKVWHAAPVQPQKPVAMPVAATAPAAGLQASMKKIALWKAPLPKARDRSPERLLAVTSVKGRAVPKARPVSFAQIEPAAGDFQVAAVAVAQVDAVPLPELPKVRHVDHVEQSAEVVVEPQPEPVPAGETKIMPLPKSKAAMTVTVPVPAAKEPEQKLKDMIQWAYAHSPFLHAARESLKADRETLPQALAGYRPTIGADGNVTYTDINTDGAAGAETTAKEAGVFLSQPLYRGGRTMAAVGSAKNFISGRKAILDATEQDFALAVTTVYMNVLRDQALVNLGRNNEDVIGRQLQASQNRFDVGEATKTDVSQAQARLAKARADTTRATGNLQSSRALYEQIIGQMPGRLVEPDVAFQIPDTLDRALLTADQTNPQIVAAQHLEKSADYDIDTIFGEHLPELSLIGSLDKEKDPSPGLVDGRLTSQVGLGVSIPIYTGGSVNSRVREARHTANQRYLEILDTKRKIRERTISAWEEVKAAKAEIVSREAQVKAAAVAREGVHQEADLGTRTILDALDSDQEYLDAQVALVIARRNEVVAVFALADMLGMLDPKTLGFPEITGDYTQYVGGRGKVPGG